MWSNGKEVLLMVRMLMICVHVPLAPSVKWETEAERQREQREATPMEEAVDGGRGRGKRREDRERGRERVAGKEGERKAADAAKSVRFSLGGDGIGNVVKW